MYPHGCQQGRREDTAVGCILFSTQLAALSSRCHVEISASEALCRRVVRLLRYAGYLVLADRVACGTFWLTTIWSSCESARSPGPGRSGDQVSPSLPL